MTDAVPDGTLTARETAGVFGRTPRTLWNWEKAGVLIPIRIRGKRHYRRSEVERLLSGVEDAGLHKSILGQIDRPMK